MTSPLSAARDDGVRLASRPGGIQALLDRVITRGKWTREWLTSTVLVAAAVTAIDGLLLQRKHDLFTGGFLSVDHLRSASEIALFLAASLLADAGLAGALVAAAMVLAGKLRLGTVARHLLAFSAGVLPLILADIVQYRLFEYLGGAFDVDLLFSLVGRDPAEVLAVSAAPAGQFVALAVLTVAVGLVLVIMAQRRWPSGALLDHAGATHLALVIVLFVAAFVGTTAVRVGLDSLDNGLRRKPSGVLFSRLAGYATDFDRDGYGLLSRVPDAAPFDRRIHPYAVDVPGNGVDEDGVAGDLPSGPIAYTESVAPAPRFVRRPDVVLVLLETFRADAVGASVNGRPVTPVLDRLGAKGISSARAWSHNGYTVQSRFHLLSGSLANLRGGRTLIDDFLANGYDVAYFSGQDESFGGNQLQVGYERATFFFDARQARQSRYSLFTTPGSLAIPYTTLVERIREFTSKRDPHRPLFLYVNFHDTHFPYGHRFIEPLIDSTVVERGDITPSRRADLQKMYLNTAANVDRAIGEVLQTVERSTGREPGVIVTADHGESLFEEGFLGHGYGLNEAQTRVPLVVSGLPLTVLEPWGQTDLRDALTGALSTGDAMNPPVRAARPDSVFQYLGHLESPAQIAFMSSSGRVTYDFRTNRFSPAEGEWLDVEGLSAPRRNDFTRLVTFWERMMLGRSPHPEAR